MCALLTCISIILVHKPVDRIHSQFTSFDLVAPTKRRWTLWTVSQPRLSIARHFFSPIIRGVSDLWLNSMKLKKFQVMKKKNKYRDGLLRELLLSLMLEIDGNIDDVPGTSNCSFRHYPYYLSNGQVFLFSSLRSRYKTANKFQTKDNFTRCYLLLATCGSVRRSWTE